ncbi:hypothetical protein ScPMuIL_010207 [Solemya velum]
MVLWPLLGSDTNGLSSLDAQSCRDPESLAGTEFMIILPEEIFAGFNIYLKNEEDFNLESQSDNTTSGWVGDTEFWIRNLSEDKCAVVLVRVPETILYMFSPIISGAIVPVDKLGTEYYIVYPAFEITANRYHIGVSPTYDNTHVKAELKTTSVSAVHVLELQMRDVFSIWEDFDLSGSRIVSDKPVAVFSTLRTHFRSNTFPTLPSYKLGKEFTVFPRPDVKEDVTIRMVSTTDNSSASILKNLPVHYTNLSRGDVIDYTFTGYDGQTYSDIVDITSDNVLLVVQSTGSLGLKYFFLHPREEYSNYILAPITVEENKNVECTFQTKNKSPFFRVESVHRWSLDNGTIGEFCPLSKRMRKSSPSQYVQLGFVLYMYSDFVSISSDSLFSGRCVSSGYVYSLENRIKKINKQCRLVRTPDNTTTFEEKCIETQVENKTDISKKNDDSNRELTGWVPGFTVAASAVASIVAASKYLKYRSRRRDSIVRPV